MPLRRILGWLPVLAIGIIVSTSAVGAQSPVPEPGDPAPFCAIVTPEELSRVAGRAFTLEAGSGGYYCNFTSGYELTASITLERTLQDVIDDFGPGETMRVAGRPAWWQESSGNLAVELNGMVLFMNAFDSVDYSDTFTVLSALASLVVPRIPPPPDPATVARLKALIPPGVPDPAAIPGWYLLADSRPAVQLLLQFLASSKASAADLVLVVTAQGENFGVLASVAGVDARELMLPLAFVVAPTAEDREVTTVTLSGKEVARIATDPPTYAYGTEELVAFAVGPDAFLNALFAGLP